MASNTLSATDTANDDIKRVPQDAAIRQAVRSVASQLTFDRSRSPSRKELERWGETILDILQLPRSFLGFAMVAASNAFWLPVFEAVPFSRRLFLLPHCLSDRDNCSGVYDSIGLHCHACGRCDITSLKSDAEKKGYSVIVAEGTSSVLMKVLEGEADALFGVACLDSLEKSFERVVELGIPHLAVPLLKDGCVDTEAENDLIRILLAAHSTKSEPAPRGYLPLLRGTVRMFQTDAMAELIEPYCDAELLRAEFHEADSVEEIAMAWLREGGKRLRPFVTVATYAVARHGLAVLEGGEENIAAIPMAIRRLALAIETLHKASLVHDDIEDDDDYRYGQPTVHRLYGIAQAVNVGDYLIGLGYRLVAGEAESLGAKCVADVLNQLTQAHLELCRGQGAELLYSARPEESHRLAEVMTVYAQKTAPAFEAAIYAGLRAANVAVEENTLRSYATFLGEAFQIRNDLDDWREDAQNKRKRGLDALSGRPTILRGLAAETEFSAAVSSQFEKDVTTTPEEHLERLRALYVQAGAFDRAEQLYRKLRERAIQAADGFPSPDLQEFMRFLARMVLREAHDQPTPSP